jgi:hypothetical protein
LLQDWRRRAGASADAHFEQATRLARANLRFGVPVVALTTLVGTGVFASLQHQVNIGLKIAVGIASVLAAVLAALQTFLRFGERAERHRSAAELWAALRREIDEMLALHPTYLASRGDPKQYLDDLRHRMAQAAQQSPEMGSHGIWRSKRVYGVDDLEFSEEPDETEAAPAG